MKSLTMSVQHGVETDFYRTPPSWHHQPERPGTGCGDTADPALQQFTTRLPPNSLEAGQPVLGPKHKVETKCVGAWRRG